ncbi:hypothetical protein J2S43_007284 [Catenuloplanes nepalensis]|uniref:ScoMcrA-like N-terminal head domain-containing protein n=1 Tax=Catenuloplanes nepalensis TaxID=587533 RepID=A0ABT9N501_9ACTN|nr:hypothetical protein [Catenuloplanes nepalensis]MDP9798772.1 hypothetical protein [Catenuloplanes nepalensis]
MSLSDLTRESVLEAIAECDTLGREAFRRRYGFGAALEYVLVHEGGEYDSKAIAGVAHRYAAGVVLPAGRFTGGVDSVVRQLSRLGFTVARRAEAARAPLVLIAPSYGNPASRARFADTLDRAVPFVDGPIRALLKEGEFAQLIRLHPDGSARFWGALARHDSKMDRLAEKDPVLFTGDNHVQAIARLGCRLRNPELADALWHPDPKTGSWSNVYTVLDFERVTDLRYDEIRALAGYSPNDVFQETRVPRSDQAAALIDGLGLSVEENPEQTDARDEARLLRALNGQDDLFEAESHHTDTSEYDLPGRKITLQRAEARLVARYRNTLSDPQAWRLRLDVGWTDLFDPARADLIEAKRSASHRHVREALGQLLDYAAHASRTIERLTALFPEAPAEADTRLLHRYGIDCLYWEGAEDFVRLEAPDAARQRMRTAWSADTDTSP